MSESAPLLLLAAALAGALNAAAGGGSFLTLPALLYCGVPPVAANATGTLALLPGYVGAWWGYRHDLRPLPTLRLPAVIGLALAGGLAGAALLLATPDRLFRTLAPILVLAGSLLFAFAPQLTRLRRTAVGPRASALGVFAVATYGGYFNGGLGILLLALCGVLGLRDLNAANGLKNLISALLTAVACVVYVAGGLVRWPEALMMAAAALLGGYFGARGARRLPASALRAGIVFIGLAMAAAMAAGL